MIKLFTKSGAEIKFKQSMFPVGENYVKIEDLLGFKLYDSLTIKWVFGGDGEFIQLALLVNAIRAINKNVKIILDCPYFPGARQDRICEPGEGFGVKVYADLINSLNFESVRVFDPHSDVTGALVENIEIIDNVTFVASSIWNYAESVNEKDNTGHAFLQWIKNNNNLITLVSPDAGANKKIFKLAKNIPWKDINIEIVRADKIRDTKTGKITGTEVYGDVKNKTLFVIDDIGSKCTTFIKLAEVLKQKKAARIILIVSHYEGTADINKLKESGIDKVYCYNDFGNLDPNDKEKFAEKNN